ncbi:hypothetical protein [Rhizobium sp. BK379]|uniref:relaxase/mobilization nuclease domain-containing protein n=1 Tax=Rhizobium sp. BK379 TaxID=2587059 RepID=UPI00161A7460|nr:hypothetical protein [Rhizobium sp. BK379]MBB3441846.1 hypothetical protein [Rhizobium sp. BK379]
MQMIVKGLRIRSKSGVNRIIRHLQNGDDNETVTFLRGTAADIQDMHRDSLARGAAYSVRHWIVAPHEMMDRPQMRQVLDMIANEFEFDAHRAVVVEHRKKRSTQDATDLHWHVLVGEVDPVTGRVLKSSFDRVVHELVARASEYAFGHPFVAGKHTETVIKGLRKRGMTCAADGLERTLLPMPPIPAEAFTHAQHQEKKRLRLDLPALRQIVRDAASDATTRADLVEALSTAGLDVKAGDKPGTWIVVKTVDGILVGALHMLASRRKLEVNMLMEPAVSTAPVEKPPTSKDHSISQGPKERRAPDFIVPLQPTQPEPPHIARSSFAQIAEELRVMERKASNDLLTSFPVFQPTSAIKRIKEELRDGNAKLKATRDRRWDIHEQLSKAPPVQWWCYAIGLAARRRRRIQDLERALIAAEKEKQRLQIAVSGGESALYREEAQAKELHSEQVRNVSRKHKSAREILECIDHVRTMISEDPALADKGVAHLMSVAEMRPGRRTSPEPCNDLVSVRRP